LGAFAHAMGPAAAAAAAAARHFLRLNVVVRSHAPGRKLGTNCFFSFKAAFLARGQTREREREKERKERIEGENEREG